MSECKSPEISFEKALTLAGYYSFGASVFVVIALAVWSGSFVRVLDDILLFLSGYALEQQGKGSIAEFVQSLPSMLMIDLILSMIGIAIATKIRPYPESNEHALGKMWAAMAHRPISYVRFFGLILMEELGARWFFLGVLAGMPLLAGSTSFYYALVLIGSLGFALVHLLNFPKDQPRYLIWALPQFVTSFPLAYVFTKYGLVPAVVLHFAADMLLFTCHKSKGLERNFARRLVFDLAMLIVLVLCEVNIDSLVSAFDPSVFLHDANWERAVELLIFVEIVSSLLFTILLYEEAPATIGKRRKFEITFLDVVLGGPLVAGGIWIVLNLAFLALGWLSSSVIINIMALLMMFLGVKECNSGSQLAQTFWQSMTSGFLLVSMTVLMKPDAALMVLVVYVLFVFFREVCVGNKRFSLA